MSHKDEAVETLRGIAIILVLSLHLVNDPIIRASGSFYEYLSYTLQHVRVPLFTVISGYLYGLRPVIGRFGYKKFAKAKVTRILIPLMVVSSAQFLAESIMPGVNNPRLLEDFFGTILGPYSHFWFLQAIFLIFLLVGLLSAFEMITSFYAWLAVTLITCLGHLFVPSDVESMRFFSLSGVIYILPFFMLGFGLSNFHSDLFTKRVIFVSLMVFGACFFAQQYFWLVGTSYLAEKRTFIGLCFSISACILLFKVNLKIGFLSYIGGFAYTIYLYQGFGASLGRRLVSDQAGPHFYMLFVVSFTVVFGILIYYICRQIPFISKLTLGVSAKKTS